MQMSAENRTCPPSRVSGADNRSAVIRACSIPTCPRQGLQNTETVCDPRILSLNPYEHKVAETPKKISEEIAFKLTNNVCKPEFLQRKKAF